MDRRTPRHQPGTTRPAARILNLLGLAALPACTAYVHLAMDDVSMSESAVSGESTTTVDPTDITGTTHSTDAEDATGATGDGTGASVDTTGPFSCPQADPGFDPMYPAGCEQILVGTPGAADGEYTLYANNDPARPWQAWCLHMDQQPVDYLILPMSGEGQNFAEYVPGEGGGTIVRTSYTRVRIDPYCLQVRVGDQTFSSSTGALMHNDTMVTSMPYAVAMDCISPNSSQGRANIDLRGTPFKVPQASFVGEGYMSNTSETRSEGDQVVNLTGGGYCGWLRPLVGIYTYQEPMNGWNGPFQLEYTQ